mmetsp:Transcript_13385/g.39912  ORF Transcript_13385/g.39912 Transcript_13385/m.39912 type:complete len:222 (+) Transcript_13385:1-666(+)
MYLGRPETDGVRCMAMGVLGSGLGTNKRFAEALPVLETHLALNRRYSSDENSVLVALSGVAICLENVGRPDESLVIKRDIYARRVATLGASHPETLRNGMNLAILLVKLKLWDDAKSLLHKLLRPAQRSLGADNETTLNIQFTLSSALLNNPNYTRDDLFEAETILQDVLQRRRRVFGLAHPQTRKSELALARMREITQQRARASPHARDNRKRSPRVDSA